MASSGKRAGARRGARQRSGINRTALALAAGITLCVVAWGYLVYLAIDFGTSARSGQSSSWAFLALASIGAVACLFTGLMLIARLLRALGITSAPDVPSEPAPPRVAGGRRAAR
ncbi:hypothetical protein [Nocardioides sp. Soil805]|uniref:hypothetical protein n=1 Tax=Nocardioides sp. Soil805 TaxID=1736416 RepID=UPI000A6BDCDB|nr:hypothetical protein [Nocardioides sp. Soil805]